MWICVTDEGGGRYPPKEEFPCDVRYRDRLSKGTKRSPTCEIAPIYFSYWSVTRNASAGQETDEADGENAPRSGEKVFLVNVPRVRKGEGKTSV